MLYWLVPAVLVKAPRRIVCGSISTMDLAMCQQLAFPRTPLEGAVSIGIFMPPMVFKWRPLPRGGSL
jgi:hypothetical protein